MTHLGLIKWFDAEKGYGKIGIEESGIVFLHINNFSTRPEEILKGTALLFEIKKDARGLSAINVFLPTSYDDFKSILFYLSINPVIQIEADIDLNNNYGHQVKREKFKSYNLVDQSLKQLLLGKGAEEIFGFFKTYFDENHSRWDYDFFENYNSITHSQITELKLGYDDFLLEVKEEFHSFGKRNQAEHFILNNFNKPTKTLIRKLLKYYLVSVFKVTHLTITI